LVSWPPEPGLNGRHTWSASRPQHAAQADTLSAGDERVHGLGPHVERRPAVGRVLAGPRSARGEPHGSLASLRVARARVRDRRPGPLARVGGARPVRERSPQRKIARA
jgi:hypothetical protein